VDSKCLRADFVAQLGSEWTLNRSSSTFGEPNSE
jgi:hypothetical protein